jgi:hypothetical protein
MTRPLGHGGMAAVWAGVDARLDRPVAVKLLDGAAAADPAMLRRLDQEARTLAKLAHPNIVAVYDLATEAGVPYVVMELVDGEDLHRRLGRGPLEMRDAIEIAVQVCDALQAAHDAGIVHRDIKPDNILLTSSGLVKVCDFGIARLAESGHSGRGSGATAVGTALYMAPEQATGGPVDARTDLYALGCVLYAMLVGRPPFSGDNPMRVMWQQVHERPVPAASLRRDVPADVEALITALLAKNPADRPADAGDVRARLARAADALESLRGAATPGSPAAMYGRAAVRPKTMAMPAIESIGRHRPEPGRGPRFRLGLAGMAAVAVGVAIVTTLVVALLMSSSPSGTPTTADGPRTGSSASVNASPTGSPTSAAAMVDGVRTIVQAQAAAGELNAETARELSGRLDEIERDLAKGQEEKAAGKVDELKDKLAEWSKDNKITDAGYAAVMGSLDQLANSLPAPRD